MNSMIAGRSIAVVGAGIVGAATALELQRRGAAVTLIDRDGPGRGASFGNMASIAVTEFMPASRPAMWAQLPRWVLDPEGPIRLKPSYLPQLMPWFLRFMAASLPSKVRSLEAAGAVLCHRVYQDLLPLLDEAHASDMLSEEGCLSLYENDVEFAADREHIEVIEKFGFRIRKLEGDEIQTLEPEISRRIRRAVLFPQNRSISDPYELVGRFVKRFQQLGGQTVAGEVVGFEREGEAISALRLKEGHRQRAEVVVLCAGAFTARLSKMLDEFIPLETERGYHTQIMAPGISMRHSIIWPAKAFMVTPTANGIRVGGTVEMAGLEAPPDFRRARLLVKRASEALPKLRCEDTSEWMGHRPALPDTVPVISVSAKTRGVFYGTGHGHLGLTYAATTARLLGDLVQGVKPPINMAAYRVDRF